MSTMEPQLGLVSPLNMAPVRHRPSRISNLRWYVRPGRRDDDDEPPPCPARVMQRPVLPTSLIAMADG